jgi:glycosyltransferase involved in cell wall biosynthesis
MSKKVLFVCLHRPDRSPSQRFRFEQYIPYLQANGFECNFSYLLSTQDDKYYYQSGNYIHKARIVMQSILKRLKEVAIQKHDIVFVQRECFMLGTSFFEKAFGKRSKLIFDFDDAIWMHQTGDSKSANKALYFLKRPGKTREIIEASDMVFAGNGYLADYARQFNENVKLIPTTLDTEIFKKTSFSSKDENKICIGWSGSFSTITHFESALPALKKIKQKYGEKVYFKLIGDGSYQHKALDIQGLPWTRENEVLKLSEIDIGIMPLPNDEWTKGKCGFKGLLYMSLEIPAILSPVGVNTEIIKNGENGLLANTIDEWVEKLSFLIENPDARKAIGEEGRKTVVEKYSVEANKKLYVKYFNEVLGEEEVTA